MNSIMIRQLLPSELGQLSEIDVSEKITLSYRMTDGKLESFARDSARPRWSADDWAKHLAEWEKHLQPDIWLGAFDGERLVGAASLRYRLIETSSRTMAQLTTLHIDKAYRRKGVAHRLFTEIKRLAMENGAQSIYVSATESESAVGFYLSLGFVPTNQPDLRLFELEPEDIHMVCFLDKG